MSEELRSALEPFLRVAEYMKGRSGIVVGWNSDAVRYQDFIALRDAVNALPALIDHLEADGGVEAMREAIDAGLKSFVRDQPDFDMSRRMRQDAIDHIIAQPGLYSALPVLGVGR